LTARLSALELGNAQEKINVNLRNDGFNRTIQSWAIKMKPAPLTTAQFGAYQNP
jgi:hypothetical protein